MDSNIVIKVQKKLPVDKQSISSDIKKRLKFRGVKSKSVEVWVVGKSKMRTLNRTFMRKDRPTDVLSFPLPVIPGEDRAGKELIGTIVVCSDIIESYSKENGTSFGVEITKLIFHGIDHLLGIHHK
jgi:probable rRNA maturation factor